MVKSCALDEAFLRNDTALGHIRSCLCPAHEFYETGGGRSFGSNGAMSIRLRVLWTTVYLKNYEKLLEELSKTDPANTVHL